MNQEKLENAKNLFFIALGVDIAVTFLVMSSDLWVLGILKEVINGIPITDQSTIGTIDSWASFSKILILTAIGVGLTLTRWLGTCYDYAKEALKATGFAQERWKVGAGSCPSSMSSSPTRYLARSTKPEQ